MSSNFRNNLAKMRSLRASKGYKQMFVESGKATPKNNNAVLFSCHKACQIKSFHIRAIPTVFPDFDLIGTVTISRGPEVLKHQEYMLVEGLIEGPIDLEEGDVISLNFKIPVGKTFTYSVSFEVVFSNG
jgi:hypothetical protein